MEGRRDGGNEGKREEQNKRVKEWASWGDFICGVALLFFYLLPLQYKSVEIRKWAKALTFWVAYIILFPFIMDWDNEYDKCLQTPVEAWT